MFARVQKSALSWRKDGAEWPNHNASCFVEAGGLRWHVQRMGRGAPLLLLHGTAGTTHSWRDFLPLLAQHFTVIAPDLPGHGFTDLAPTSSLSLPGMARGIAALLDVLDVKPAVAVGHSAGAAIVARLCIDAMIAPKLFISINGALLPFEGFPGQLFPTIAKLLYVSPFAPRVFAWSADRTAVSRLIGGTGSTIDDKGLDLYERLFSNPDHVASALGMMANWDLATLARDLKRLKTPLVLIAAKGDLAVPYSAAERVVAIVPNARIETLRGVGHLSHEERPDLVASLVVRFAEEASTAAKNSALN